MWSLLVFMTTFFHYPFHILFGKKKKRKIFSDVHCFLPDRMTQTSNLQIFWVQVKLKATVWEYLIHNFFPLYLVSQACKLRMCTTICENSVNYENNENNNMPYWFFFFHRKCHFHIKCCLIQIKYIVQGFPGPVGKNPAAKAVDTG